MEDGVKLLSCRGSHRDKLQEEDAENRARVQSLTLLRALVYSLILSFTSASHLHWVSLRGILLWTLQISVKLWILPHMNRAHEPGEAENDRWALAEHLRVGADHADHVVQCASFTSLPLQEFIAVISQLDTVIISGDKNAAQSDRMFPQDNIAEVWNHHAGPGFRILSTDWYPGMKHTKMRFHKQRRRRGEDWNATDLQWKIETSCVSVCLWCDVMWEEACIFLKLFPRHQTTSGSLSPSLSL